MRAVLNGVVAAALCGSVFLSLAMRGDDAVEKTRLEKMLTPDSDGMVVAVFKRHPGQTLPFIDRYLEGGLAMIEKAGPSAQADSLASFHTGIKFAALADRAFGGTTFSDYANAFASWSPSEQKSFRDGQRLFKAGMKAAADDPAKAKLLLQQSLARAEALGDLWGKAMALGGLAEVCLKSGDAASLGTAAGNSQYAADLYGELRLNEDRVQALRLNAKAHAARKLPWGERDALSMAWGIVSDNRSLDDALCAAVVEEYASALEAQNQRDAATDIRQRYQEMQASKEDAEKASKPVDATKK